MRFKVLSFAIASFLPFSMALAADQELHADVVVVGAGAGGTVAAVSAVEGGLKTVLLEKMLFLVVTATIWKVLTLLKVLCKKRLA